MRYGDIGKQFIGRRPEETLINTYKPRNKLKNGMSYIEAQENRERNLRGLKVVHGRNTVQIPGTLR